MNNTPILESDEMGGNQPAPTNHVRSHKRTQHLENVNSIMFGPYAASMLYLFSSPYMGAPFHYKVPLSLQPNASQRFFSSP